MRVVTGKFALNSVDLDASKGTEQLLAGVPRASSKRSRTEADAQQIYFRDENVETGA